MDLGDLQSLVRIVEHGSFQAAARQLKVSRTTLQRQVDRLEALVGLPLVTRDERGVRPTEAGDALLERASTLLDHASALVHHARATGSEPRGRIRIAEPVGLPIHVRLQGIALLRMAHPELEVVLQELADPLAGLGDDFDVALHFGPPPDRPEWVSRVVRRTPLQLRASPSYLASRGCPTCSEDLADHTLLTWSHPSLVHGAWPLTDGSTLAVAPALTANNPALIRELAAQGLGIALFPHATLDPDLDAELVVVLDGVVGRPEALRVTAIRPSSANPRTRSVQQSLEGVLEQLPAN